MSRWFKVGHSIDNYEEQIDLSEVVFVRCSYRYLSGNEGSSAPLWSYDAKILFRNGRSEKVSFTKKGYKEFLDMLRGKGKG